MATVEHRWKVRRRRTMFFHPNEEDVCYGPRWCVTSPTGVAWGNYATHAEAMKRADRQARTVTVTLPRLTHSMRKKAYDARYSDGIGYADIAHPKFLEYFALKLLAQARWGDCAGG